MQRLEVKEALLHTEPIDLKTHNSKFDKVLDNNLK